MTGSYVGRLAVGPSDTSYPFFFEGLIWCALAPKMGTLKWRHCHSGIMSRLPTSRNF